jgi:hypothetical protein
LLCVMPSPSAVFGKLQVVEPEYRDVERLAIGTVGDR